MVNPYDAQYQQQPWMAGFSPLHGAGQFIGFGGAAQPQSPNEAQMFMDAAPPAFLALQGMQPGFAPQDFNQMLLSYALSSGAPQRNQEFGGRARERINRYGQQQRRSVGREADATYAAGANQLGGQQRQNQGQQLDAFAAMGLAPSMFQASYFPQQQMEMAAALGALRAQAEAQRAQGMRGVGDAQFQNRMGLDQSLLNLNNADEYRTDALMMDYLLGQMAAQAQMNAAGRKADSDELGAILGIGGSILGGPIGGVIGDFIGGLF